MSDGNGIKRRDFLKVLGVGGAGASLVGCSTEEVEKLLPYVVPPEDITPGVATWYTTVCQECSAGCGMWVRTREGRVVKVEGNPAHDISGGALCARGHSSLQGLYNPDRFAGPMVREGGVLRATTWAEAEQLLANRLAAAGSSLFITGDVGPSLADVVDRFVAATGGSRVRYSGVSEAPLREAARIAFGRDEVPSYDMEQAKFIVSFGADFLEGWLSPVEHGRGFARMHGVDHGEKGRMAFVGPRLSLTGQNADDWYPVAPGSEALVALAMANVISGGGASAGPYASVVNGHTPEGVAEATGVSAEAIRELARRFGSDGTSLALGPGLAGQHRNATASNLAVLILNAVAGNVGRTLHFRDADLSAPSAPYADIAGAIGRMSGAVVLVHGCNPAYTLPAASGFDAAFASADFRVSFASAPDETTATADLILPDAHFLEAWGDSNPRPGIYALQQPAMQVVSLFDSKQAGDVLLSVASTMGQALGPVSFYEHLRTRWHGVQAQAGTGGDFETFWRGALKDGVVRVDVSGSEATSLRTPDTALVFDVPTFDGSASDLILMVYPSARFGDGALNGNRPWLHELPDPVSKITWHSWVELHPHTAERMGLVEGDIVTVASPHGSVELPLWPYPGVREDVIAIAMGGGHTDAGRFANGNGVNAMDLLPAVTEAPSGALVHLATRASVTATGERRRLATISGSEDQDDRNIAPAVALTALGHAADEAEGDHGPRRELQGIGGFVPVETDGEPQDFPLPGTEYGPYADAKNLPRWAMAVDLDKCTGCSACITACQAENNVAWAGEGQVQMGRDMMWIRIERYYEHIDATKASHVDVRRMMMICQHCGNAPCETVCPVFATYHTPEGLNAQIYNRCVGTRYCLNNCPYKVRVFNWYEYNGQEPVFEGMGHAPEPMNWQFNPDVTVRTNGIMEKCSFCIHRIKDAQHRAAIDGGQVTDAAVVPACSQSCPAEAIVFGNIRDPESRVAQLAADERAYRVLDEVINTQPAVNYLKKVTFHDVESGGH